MREEYVRSSPHFFRLIKIAFAVALVLLLALAFVLPAPLQEAADPGRVPNPSKSAWFLLWTQELVSYSKYLVYLILALGAFFLALPWLPLSPPAQRARWWPEDQRAVNWITALSFAGIVLMTIVAMYFRGKNWDLVWPF